MGRRRRGASARVGLWAWKLRRLNGPNFTWPLLMFASALPESLMAKMGKLYAGRPLAIKTRRELLATIRPNQRRYLRQDNGDLPDGWTPGPLQPDGRGARIPLYECPPSSTISGSRPASS